jgi:hypothetical protein
MVPGVTRYYALPVLECRVPLGVLSICDTGVDPMSSDGRYIGYAFIKTGEYSDYEEGSCADLEQAKEALEVWYEKQLHYLEEKSVGDEADEALADNTDNTQEGERP